MHTKPSNHPFLANTIVAALTLSITVVLYSHPATAHEINLQGSETGQYNHIYLADNEGTTTVPAGDEKPAPDAVLKKESEKPATESRQQQDSQVMRSDAKPHPTKQNLPNFHKVHDYLYRGGEPNEAGLKELKQMGVKTVIDLRAPTEKAINEKKIAKELGLKYINLPMSSKPPTKSQVETLLSTVDRAKEKNEPVMVHCAHGSDRAGCMIGIVRVTRDGWGFDETYKEMRKYYFGPKFTALRDAVKTRATR